MWHCLLGNKFHIESTTSLFFTETYSSTIYLRRRANSLNQDPGIFGGDSGFNYSSLKVLSGEYINIRILSVFCVYCGDMMRQGNNLKLSLNNLRRTTFKKYRWLNTTRLENRKLSNSESEEKYIEDMSKLALLVGIKEEELSKALIRVLPLKLRWNVVSFNPTTLSESIQIILLGEATLSFNEEKTRSTK